MFRFANKGTMIVDIFTKYTGYYDEPTANGYYSADFKSDVRLRQALGYRSRVIWKVLQSALNKGKNVV